MILYRIEQSTRCVDTRYTTWTVSCIPDVNSNLKHTFIIFFIVGANEDYFSGPYFVVFPARMTQAVFNILLIDDNISEETETFINSSSLPNNVTIGELGEAEVTSLDNVGEFSWIGWHSHYSVTYMLVKIISMTLDLFINQGSLFY